MGPAEFGPGLAINVRPQPHIDLATVTYLFEGEIVHRDSLGSVQATKPGDVNWMTAGSGIAHSERSAAAMRNAGARPVYGTFSPRSRCRKMPRRPTPDFTATRKPHCQRLSATASACV